MIKAVAHIQLAHRSIQVESGVWESEDKAREELRFLIMQVLPIGESFKVIQSLKHI